MLDNPFDRAQAARERTQERVRDEVSPFDAAAARREETALGAVQASQTLDVQPDRAAQALDLAATLTVPYAFALRTQDALQRGVQERSLRETLRAHPATALFMSDPAQAAVAQDSVPSLAEIEARVRAERDARRNNRFMAPVNLTRSAIAGVLGLGVSGARGQSELLRDANMGGDVIGPLELAAQSLGAGDQFDVLERVIGGSGNPAVAIAAEQNIALLDMADRGVVDAVRPDDQGFAGQVSEALGQIAGAVALTLTTGNAGPAASLFSGMGADQQAQRMRGLDMDPANNSAALQSGAAVTALTESVRLRSILRVLPRSARDAIARNIFGRIARQGAEEAGEEALEQIGQNLIAMGYDAEAQLLEGLGESAAVGGTAGAVFQALVEVALPGRARGGQAEQAAQTLTDIKDAVDASPLMQRRRASMEEFLAQATDGETVLLDADGVVELYQADGFQFLDQFGVTEDQVRGAFGGTDVEVPVSALLAADRAAYDRVIERVRTDPEALTLAEAANEAIREALDADMREVVERLREEDAQAEGFEVVQREVTAQLQNAGRSLEEAQAAGAVWGSVFRTMEERFGVDAAQVFERLGLRIERAEQEGERRDAALDALIEDVRREAFPRESEAYGPSLQELAADAGIRITDGSVDAVDDAVIDAFGERAFEEGFFGQRPSVNELRDALEGDPVYRPEARNDAVASRLEAMRDLQERVQRMGLDLAEMDNAAVRQAMGERTLNQSNWSSDLDALASSASDDGVRLDLSSVRGDVVINRIEANNVGQGAGSRVMQRLADWADDNGVRLLLTPEAIGATSVGRLERFYRRFGFVPNRGRNRDFSTQQAMIREPQSRILYQGDDAPRASVIIPGDGVLSDGDTLVKLTQAADKTSFLHESAHIYLEILAALEGENEAVAAEMATIRDWLGSEAGARLTRAQHETFAESFEAYLMEGQAPSAELRGVFRKFRAWFLRVYRAIRNQIKLDPRAKDVFDRLLATDAEIADAQSRYGREMSAAMRGLMEPEFVERYEDQARKAGDLARDRLFAKHVAEIERRESRRYREGLKQARQEAESEIMALPVYRAWDAFVSGDGPRLDRAAIVELRGQSAPGMIAQGKRAVYVREGGVHPDVLAGDYGFATGDEMVLALMNASHPKEAIAREVERKMKERFGDIATDGTVEREAIAAVFNEPSVRMLQVERDFLANKAGRQPIPMEAIKARAEQEISERPIRDVVKPGQYAQQAANLHKKAIRAAMRERWDDALRYTHQALLQHELARRAFKARDEIQKANRFLARYALHRKLDAKAIDPAYIAQLRNIMALPGAEDQAPVREALLAFADEQAEQGRAVVLPNALSLGRDIPGRTEMTLQELREFRDAVKSLAHVGRGVSEQTRAERAEEHARAAAVINESWGDRRRLTYRRSKKWHEEFGQWVRKADAALLSLPFIAETLEGGKRGLVVDALYNDIAEAQTRRERRMRLLQDGLVDILDRHGITQSEMNQRVSVPNIDPERDVTMQQVFAVLLNMGTQSNADRLVSDVTINGDEAEILAMLESRLEKRHFDAAQEIWNLIETQKEDLGRVWRERTGVTPRWVEARELQTRFGTYRGGYYPLAYDPAADRNSDIAEQQLDDVFKQFNAASAARAQTRSGMLKERAENVERPLFLSLDVLLKHFDETAGLIEMTGPIDRAWNMVSSGTVARAINETRGREYVSSIKDILKRAAVGRLNADAGEAQWLNAILRGFRINASVAILGANLQTAMLAPVSYFQTVIPRYGFKTVARGWLEFYGRGPQTTVKRSVEMEQKSEFMRERAALITREAHERVRMSIRESGWSKFQAAGYVPMAQIEKYSVSGPLWWGVYSESLEQGLTEAQAIQEADKAVNTTQGSGRVLDQSILQSSPNEMMRVLTFMWGYVSRYYGVVRNDVAEADGLKKLMPLVKHMVIMNLAASMAEALLRNPPSFDDEDEDPYTLEVLRMFGRNSLGMFPGSQALFSRYATEPALFSIDNKVRQFLGAIGDAGEEVYERGRIEGETAERLTRSGIDAVGFGLGVPGTVQAQKALRTLSEDDDPTLYEAIVSGPDDDN